MTLAAFRRGYALILAALIGITAAGCVILEAHELELVYRAVRDDGRTPRDAGLDFEELWLAVPREDGNGSERVHAWWLPARNADAPAVLFLHGIRGSLGNNLYRIARWHALGFGVLAIDYRGFGRSDGALPSEAQIYADARVGWQELARREPRSERRFIYGHSLGAAVALELAARVGDAAGVIAEAGFTSLPDVVGESYGPLNLLLSQKFDALGHARALRAPALFIHGTADRLVPPSMSERLHAAAPAPKHLHWIEGGSHGNRSGTGLDGYRRAILEFVAAARSHARMRSAATVQPPALRGS